MAMGRKQTSFDEKKFVLSGVGSSSKKRKNKTSLIDKEKKEYLTKLMVNLGNMNSHEAVFSARKIPTASTRQFRVRKQEISRNLESLKDVLSDQIEMEKKQDELEKQNQMEEQRKLQDKRLSDFIKSARSSIVGSHDTGQFK